jgi:uncharacterized protein (TIGR03435 family)
MRRIAFLVLIFATALTAQQPAAPAFDVVSIRVIPPNAPPGASRDQYFSPILPGGEYYSIAAKPADGFTVPPPAQYREQLRLMMRAMLADRFHLRLHTENRPESIFKLEIAKGGMKLKEVEPPVPPEPTGNVNAVTRPDGGIRMIAKKSTMERLAVSLDLLTGKPVVDETGLTGYYDFDVTWKGPVLPDGQAPETRFGGAELVGLLISNLQSQFGLSLASATGPVEYWVVDHVDPPTEN